MMEHDKYLVTIKNCNCIKQAGINLQEGTLNIKYGLNGTGKSTIGLALQAEGNHDVASLAKLLPYNSNKEIPDQCPAVLNLPFTRIRVFNDEYANNYLFKGENFFDDSFRVFLHSNECDSLTSTISSMLDNLQNMFQTSEDLTQLRSLLPQLFDILKLKNGEIPKSGGVGDLLKGNGYGFDKHKELTPYRNFYEREDFLTVSKWAKWRRDGIVQMNGENCPFCTAIMDTKKIENQNQVIIKVFKNSAITTANKILDYLKNAFNNKFMSEDSIKKLQGYLGDSSKASELEVLLNFLAAETQYLIDKINSILMFKPMNVTRDQLNRIEQTLNEMMLDKGMLNTFYCTETVNSLIQAINGRIADLKKATGKLKGLFFKYDKKLNELIQNRKDDVNNFLSLAGFPYKFQIDSDGDQKATTYLVPITATDMPVPEPAEHLSWGEKNAFSLVMFMFEAISDKADLIVLDDPISAFDANKKFAIIQRMFDNQKASFRDRTVLMLTHDTQPLIDYVKEESFKKYGITTAVNAEYLENINGIIREREIQAQDLKSVIHIAKSIVQDTSSSVITRIVNLRKFVELTSLTPDKKEIYHVLSNLIHGRETPVYKDKVPLESGVLEKGCYEIRKYINDFDYGSYLHQLNDKNLASLYKRSVKYEKILIARLLLERYEGMLNSLRRKYPALCKYINETNHVENDFVYQLDPREFFNIPEKYVHDLDDFLSEEQLIIINN